MGVPEPAAPGQARAAGRWSDRRVAALLYGGLGVMLVTLIALLEQSPEQSAALMTRTGLGELRWTWDDTPPIAGTLSGLAALGLLATAAVRAFGLGARRRLVVTGRVLLIVLVIASGFAWLYGMRGIARRHYIKPWDSFHYVLGPKYFDEVGYFHLYDCIAAADAQTVNKLKGGRVRDLRDYRYYMRLPTAAKRGKCEERFSPARWEEFKRDYAFYTTVSGRKLKLMAKDRGYNGTPFHMMVSKALLNSFDTSYRPLTFATLGDTLPVLAMFYALSVAFGWEVVAFVAIFFFSLFSDRGQFILGSFFRYHWMYCTGFALAALQLRKHAQAGAWVATAGLLNVFPVLFGLGVTIKGLWELITTRTLSRSTRRFVAGAVIAGVLLGGASLLQHKGVETYRDFFANMDQHAGVMSVSRVGLKYDFLWRGELHIDRYSAMYTREEARSTKPIYLTAAAVMFFVLFVVARRLDEVEATALAGFAAFFYIFTTVSYYYGIFALLLLLLRKRLDRPLTWALLALPFALNVCVVWLFQHSGRSLGLANNTGMSFMVTAVLLVFQWARLSEGPDTRADRVLRLLARAGIVATVAGIVVVTLVRMPPSKVAAEPSRTAHISFGGEDEIRRDEAPEGKDACRPRFIDAGGLRVELFELHVVRNREAAFAPGAGCAYARGDVRELRDGYTRRIAGAVASGHVPIISVDWKRGRIHAPNRIQRSMTRALLLAGARAVVGRSAASHLGVRTYRGRPILDALPLGSSERVTFSLSTDGVTRVRIDPDGRHKRMWQRSAAQGTLLTVLDGVGYLELKPPRR
jgi:hypothetical protein